MTLVNLQDAKTHLLRYLSAAAAWEVSIRWSEEFLRRL